MNLLSIASAFPSNVYTQQECLDAMQTANFWPELAPRSRQLLNKVLSSDSGIDYRHLALDHLDDAWKRDAQELNADYEKEAPRLGADAVQKALGKSGHNTRQIDALLVCSCTGYLCPGLSGHIAEALNLREDVCLQDMTGLGCGAAVPLMRMANALVSEKPDAVIVTVAVEVCSAAFYVEDDFGVLISTCLFGDGAAAAVWSGTGGEWQVGDFHSLHKPEHREKIRFTNAGGKLRNQLHKDVPFQVAQAISQLYKKRTGDPQAWITHGGGRDVIEQLERVLPCDQLNYARNVMQHYGNLSSPSVLVALEQFLEKPNSHMDRLWLSAFGAGFSAHSCEMTRV